MKVLSKAYLCNYSTNSIVKLNVANKRVKQKDRYECIAPNGETFTVSPNLKGVSKVFDTFDEAKSCNILYWVTKYELEVELQKARLENLNLELEIARNIQIDC